MSYRNRPYRPLWPPEPCINERATYPPDIPDRPADNSAARGFYTPLEGIEYLPGQAVRLLNDMPNFTRFVDYIGARLESTGLPARYALEQLHAHPEVSLDELCSTLSRLARSS